MALHFFSIPALNGAAEQDALNRFCASHPVVTLEHQLVQAGIASFWAVAVTVRDGPTALERSAPQRAGAEVDYKEVLNEADFRLYSALRELRKTVAQQEGVAVYAVFTNEQLAAMVTGRGVTPTARAWPLPPFSKGGRGGFQRPSPRTPPSNPPQSPIFKGGSHRDQAPGVRVGGAESPRAGSPVGRFFLRCAP